MDWKCGSIVFFSSGKLQCLFGGNFIKVSLLKEIIEEKFGGIKKISYFCNRVMSERKRTGTMKALVNERIERYLAIEMWKFQSLLTINRQLCSRLRIIVSFSLWKKMLIYSMAWAIALLLADGSFHNLYPVISNSPTLFH